jgi:hypothetical protein
MIESSAARLDSKQATDANAIPTFQSALDVRTPSFTARAVASLLALAAATGTLLAAIGFAQSAQSARQVQEASPLVSINDEPSPKLTVDPPLPNLLDKGIVLIQYRVENLRIVPVFGAAALNVSPRVGHLHIHFDDLPWLWADASGINTIDLAGVPAGQHKVLIELVDANHHAFPGQAKTVTFTVRGTAPH